MNNAFFSDLLASISERGRTLLRRAGSSNGKQDASGLIELCEALLSGRGEASGTAMAREVGTSARTLSRLFSLETQLSFKSWCQRARIAAAIERLSMEANVSVKQLAADLGYASVPAFSHAFRQVTGKTPTQFSGKV